jgi:hypothetical protein
MEAIIILINHFFDVLWSPFSKTPYYVEFIIISAISAWIFLFIFKKASNQDMIRHYKGAIIAHILEIRLYKDQPSLTIKIIFNILIKNLIYLRYTLVPILIILPFILIISIQLNSRYGYMPLKKGNTFIIHAELDNSSTTDIANIPEKIRCDTSKGISIETPSMVIESERSIYWRAKVIGSEKDRQYFRILLDGSDYALKKNILTFLSKQRFSPDRTKYNLQSLFLNYSEEFIPGTSPFKSLSINNHRASYPFLAWNMDPIVLYFILTLILGLAFKPFISVDF